MSQLRSKRTEYIRTNNLWKNTVNEFGIFTIYWAEFEELLRKENISTKNNFAGIDDAVNFFLNKTNLEELNNIMDKIRKKLITYYNNVGVGYLLGYIVGLFREEDYDNGQLKDKFREDLMKKYFIDKINNQDKIKATLHVVYRIRNNLLHGNKIKANYNKQNNLFKSINCFLQILIS